MVARDQPSLKLRHELLNGTGYTIDPKGACGWLHGSVFTLRAPSDTFSTDGSEMMAILVSELAAIARLGELSQTGVLADALAASTMKTGAAIGKAVMILLLVAMALLLGGCATRASRTLACSGECLDGRRELR